MNECERRRLRFGRGRRLLRRSDFLRVYSGGVRRHGRLVTVFCLPRDPVGGGGPDWRLGITATRKTGRAHERNRQRRRVREFFRLRQDEIPVPCDYVVNTTRRLTRAPAEEVERDLTAVLAWLKERTAKDRTPPRPDSTAPSGEESPSE